jgi:chemotaxis signal transduction protein
MTSRSPIAAKLAELRNAFDQTRATPMLSDAEEQTESLLAIRVSRDPYAIRVNEISGLSTDRNIVAFPTPFTELLGVAGIRGTLVPVYSLAALLGYAGEMERTRWLALCGNEEPVALAFSVFEGYLQVPLKQLYAIEQKDVTRSHVKHLVRSADMIRAVVSIPLIREALQERCGNKSVSKER